MTEHYHGHCPYCQEEVPLNMRQVKIEQIRSDPNPNVGFQVCHPYHPNEALEIINITEQGHLITSVFNTGPGPDMDKYPNFVLSISEVKVSA